MEAVEQVSASQRGLGRELGVEIRARRFTGGGEGNEMTQQPTRGGALKENAAFLSMRPTD